MPRAGLVNFCSNDYLGLANHPEVVRAFVRTPRQKYGVGSGASHLVTGHGPNTRRSKTELAAFTGREKALVFSTGYMANMGVIGALADQNADYRVRQAQSCVTDRWLPPDAARTRSATATAMRRTRTSCWRRSTEPSKRGCSSPTASSAWTATWRRCPSSRARARQTGAWLIVDDAHGLGVLGATGRGSCEHFGLSADDVPVLVGTFGKAFGTFGAFVAGDADLIDFLIQKSRTYIYTTALPPAVAAATRAALRVSQRESWRREKVLALADAIRRGAARTRRRERRGPGTARRTTIVPVILGDAAARAGGQQERSKTRVSSSRAIRPPTVPRGHGAAARHVVRRA